tara:strand:+ start:315 stop:530 length:216 start_codon:yes stop_codon:yes gene_type:complete
MYNIETKTETKTETKKEKKRPPPIIIPNKENKKRILMNHPTPHAPIVAIINNPVIQKSPDDCYYCLGGSKK